MALLVNFLVFLFILAFVCALAIFFLRRLGGAGVPGGGPPRYATAENFVYAGAALVILVWVLKHWSAITSALHAG